MWITSATTNQQLIYDRHNVIYIYDHEEAIRGYFEGTSFKEADVRFPAPHIHYYREENDDDESDIIEYWDWIHTPLKETDEA